MTAIIQFFTSHFFGNMVYGIINNIITFVFVWFIDVYKRQLQGYHRVNTVYLSGGVVGQVPLLQEFQGQGQRGGDPALLSLIHI